LTVGELHFIIPNSCNINVLRFGDQFSNYGRPAVFEVFGVRVQPGLAKASECRSRGEELYDVR